ncbi:DinB family protein [Niabella sp.]|uniref:DinB family protein n=1 Tax=Niabella sp. TaxID=1962976 RepID=UPI0026305E14|nr:DinB family protein [Niabella sp.]
METKKEVWLRGERDPLLAAGLQPAADALLQAGEELELLLADFPDAALWVQPAGVAAVGFHLKHIAGVLDRLLSYAEEQLLTPVQLAYLKNEAVDQGHTTQELLQVVQAGIGQAIRRYRKLDAGSLGAFRKVGRAGLPSTVIGLCFHAAEHTMRHTGQLLVTVAVVRKGI